MNTNNIQSIITNCKLPDTCNDIQLKETHISWIILTDHYAFKIKKPVKFSFLDFSTLENRKHYCNKELELNKRLAPQMYLDVIPIYKKEIENGENNDTIIDYAVKMIRMDNDKEMDKLLEKDKVNETHIEKLAQQMANFHKEAKIIKNVFDVTGFQEQYNDILSQIDFIEEKFGKEFKQEIDRNIKASGDYLFRKRSFMNERTITGFIRDCHGDLNSRNIFLYDDPVIFDCIDFNDELRQIDILNDIAFLCVDLEFFAKEDLSKHFYHSYLEAYGLNDDDESKILFNYYKSYRANVRGKVALIKAGEDKENEKQHLQTAKSYLQLMVNYTEYFEK